MPQSKQTTLENKPERENDTPADNETAQSEQSTSVGDVVEWQCPYCDQTRQTPREIRDHITSSTEDEHMGKSGWSAPDDIVGYDAQGNVARVIEGFTPTEDPEEQQKERGWKKKQIINAWLSRMADADVDAVTGVTDASRQYVYQVLGDIYEDNFTDQEIAELRDSELQEQLGEQIDDFHDQQEKVTMSAEAQLEDDDQIPVPRGQGREYLYNALLLAPDLDYKALPKILDISKEYSRRVFKEVRNGEVDISDVEDAYDEHVQRELMDSLETIGLLEGVEASISDTYEGDIEEAEETAEEEEEEEWPSIDAKSKTLVINSYLLAEELGEELPPKVVSKAAGCGYEYARRTMKELREEEIPQHEIDQEAATDLQNTLREIYAERGYLPGAEEEEPVEAPAEAQQELEVVVGRGEEVVTDFETDTDGTATTCIRVKDDGNRCEITAQEDSHFCHMHRPEQEEETAEAEEEEELPEVPGSKRDALLNLYTFDLDLTNSDAGDVAGASSEYARQTYNKISDGEITEADIDSAQDEEIKSVLRERLEAEGHLEPEEEFEAEEPVAAPETEDEAVTEEEPAVEAEPESETEETTAAETVTVSEAVEGDMVPASEVERVKEHAELLLRQAKYEGDGTEKKAEFIAKEISEELEELLQE